MVLPKGNVASLEGQRPDTKASREWVTLALILGCYAGFIGLGALWMSAMGWFVLPGMAVLAAFHTSLQHETIHGHPTRYAWFNELLVSLPLAVVFPYRRYRDLHLLHHNDASLTDPYEDPESYFWPYDTYEQMWRPIRWLFLANNTLVGRLLIGPWLTLVGFARTEFVRLVRGEEGVRAAWLLHGCGLCALAGLVITVFGMPLWIYALCIVYPALSLTALRAYAEHQAAENVGARTAVVEASPIWSLLYLNNNLHIVHHANPAEPWYALPDLYRERRHVFLAANDNTLFTGYREIFARFAFRVKQPVEHPFLYRSCLPTRSGTRDSAVSEPLRD
ncbi:MAG: fatty acid desaturase [Pseudomonadota bacterium]